MSGSPDPVNLLPHYDVLGCIESLKIHVHPKPQNTTLFGKGLCRCKDEVIWIRVGTQSHMAGVLIRRKRHTDTHTGRQPREDRGRAGVMPPQVR